MVRKSSPALACFTVFIGHADSEKSTLANRYPRLIVEMTGEDFFFLDKDQIYFDK
jgi:hypothetical protein